ncbi:MAG: YceG family protein [Ruminococcus sp.]|nr:YceG family protein [Ruminococcus sp.]
MKFEGFSTASGEASPIAYLATTAETFPSDVLKLKSERTLLSDSYNSSVFYVYFAALIGAPVANDTDDYYVYRNMLFTLRDNLLKSPKCLIYIENGMRSPTPEEMNIFSQVPQNDRKTMFDAFLSLVKINGDPLREKAAVSALENITSKIPDEELYALCVRIITWLSRCTRSSHYINACSEIPLLLFYGKITKDEIIFLHFMSMTGIDVLYISENKQAEKLLKTYNLTEKMQVLSLPVSGEVPPFPDRLLKVKVATDAYRASKQLDEYLYGSDTFFRDFQFPKIQALTLKTTLDEIDVLWHEQAKYRSGFRVDGDRATVPNIFAKISGVKGGDVDDYFDSIRMKLSPMSIITRNTAAYKRDIDASQLRIYQNYIKGEHIETAKLKNSQLNKFQFLSENIQNTIFEKMQEAADSGFLKLGFAELLPQIIHVGINLDKNLLHLYQKYDFTKDIPKFIIIDAIEDTFSKVECIQLVLYNLLGFDIIIYTPTGYRNLETFVDDSAFESYIQGEYKYKISIPRFKIPNKIPEPKTGLFGRLFK